AASGGLISSSRRSLRSAPSPSSARRILSATPLPPPPTAPTSIARTRMPAASIAASTGTTADAEAPLLVTTRTLGSATQHHVSIHEVWRPGPGEHGEHPVCTQ